MHWPDVFHAFPGHFFIGGHTKTSKVPTTRDGHHSATSFSDEELNSGIEHIAAWPREEQVVETELS